MVIVGSHGCGVGFIVTLCVLSLSYVSLAGSTVRLRTVQWDEFTDLTIAQDLADHPLGGSVRDPSQARLPMYLTAAAYKALRKVQSDATFLEILYVSRWISIAFMVMAIWVTALLGRRLFNPATGLLAAGLMTFSPYVLDFGRDAMTQGDALTPGLLVVALIAFMRFEHRRTDESLFTFALSMGVAIASKFTLLALIPALMLYQVLGAALERRRHRPVADPPAASWNGTASAWPFTGTAVVTGLCASGAVLSSIARANRTQPAEELLLLLARAAWVASLIGLATAAVLALSRSRRAALDSTSSHTGFWSLPARWLAILPLAIATLLALFPEHIFNRAILLSLVERATDREGADFLGTAAASLRLYSAILLLKLGLPFGIVSCLALAWMCVSVTRDRGLLLAATVLGVYGGLLLLLPLQQPFWPLTVYPLVLLVLSAFIVRHLRVPAPRMVRLMTASGLVIGTAWLGVGVYRVYPMFGYYGYETIGERWLGANSRGYRAPVVMTNDGSTQAIEWLEENAPRGSIVMSYLDDIFLLNSLQTTRLLPFRIRHALSYGDPAVLGSDLAGAEFVVVRTAGDVAPASDGLGAEFEAHFDPEPIHEIRRGRGRYRQSVIQVFGRRQVGDTLTPMVEGALLPAPTSGSPPR